MVGHRGCDRAQVPGALFLIGVASTATLRTPARCTSRTWYSDMASRGKSTWSSSTVISGSPRI